MAIETLRPVRERALNALAAVFTAIWGERCPRKEGGCMTCAAWVAFDMIEGMTESSALDDPREFAEVAGRFAVTAAALPPIATDRNPSPIVARLISAISDSEHDHPDDDSYIVDLTRRDAVAAVLRIAELKMERDQAALETGELRVGIAAVLGMPWPGGVCPDDKDIIAEVQRRCGNNQ